MLFECDSIKNKIKGIWHIHFIYFETVTIIDKDTNYG